MNEGVRKGDKESETSIKFAREGKSQPSFSLFPSQPASATDESLLLPSVSEIQ